MNDKSSNTTERGGGGMQLTRRDFIKLSAAGVGGSAAGALAAPSAARAAGDALGILYDPSLCIGCRACQMACKQWNNLPRESTDPGALYESPTGLSAITPPMPFLSAFQGT